MLNDHPFCWHGPRFWAQRCSMLFGFFIGGCCTIWPTKKVEVHSDPNPYLIDENGALKHVYVTTVSLEYRNLETSESDAVLTETPVHNVGYSDVCRILHSPRNRKLDGVGAFDLLALANAITPPYKGDMQGESIRWIICNSPVVVGIGTRSLKRNDIVPYLGVGWRHDRLVPSFTYRFMEDSVMSETVTDLYVLRQWPEHAPAHGSAENLVAMIRGDTSHISLKPATALRTLIQSKPWESLKVGGPDGLEVNKAP